MACARLESICIRSNTIPSKLEQAELNPSHLSHRPLFLFTGYGILVRYFALHMLGILFVGSVCRIDGTVARGLMKRKSNEKKSQIRRFWMPTTPKYPCIAASWIHHPSAKYLSPGVVFCGFHVVLPCVLVPGAVKSRHWVAASLVLCRHGSQTPDSQSAYNLNSDHPTRQIMMDLISGTVTKPDAYRKQNIVVIRSVASQALERSFNGVPNRRGAAAHVSGPWSRIARMTPCQPASGVENHVSVPLWFVPRSKACRLINHHTSEIHRHGAASAMDLPPLAIPTRTPSLVFRTHTPYPIPMSLLPPSSCIRIHHDRWLCILPYV